MFLTQDFNHSLNGAVKYVILKSAGANVVVVGNFDVTPQPINIAFPLNGAWYDQVNGATINISGGSYSATLAPGEYHMYSSQPLQ